MRSMATFPQLSGRWQVSVDGGNEPQWRGDSKELYYTKNDRKLMAAKVKPVSGAFETEAPEALFETPLLNQGRNRFVLTRDGQRFR